LKLTVTDILRRGYTATAANWQLVVIRIVEFIVMIGIVIGAVVAIIIPIAISAGMGNFGNLADKEQAASAIVAAIVEHWMVIVYALLVALVVLLILIVLHAFVDGATTRILVDSERAGAAPAFDTGRWFAGGAKSWWAVFWIYNAIWSIACFVLLVPLVITIAGMFAVSDPTPRVVIGCAGLAIVLLICIPLSVIAHIWVQKAIVVCLAQNAKAADAIRIARREFMGDFGRHFAVALLVLVVSIGGSGVISMVTIPLGSVRADSVSMALFAPIQIAASLLQSVFSAAVGTWFLASFAALTENR
jgi:hypothetical protein